MSSSSIFYGIIAIIALLSVPVSEASASATVGVAHQDDGASSLSKSSQEGTNTSRSNSSLVRGNELLSEIKQLQSSLSRITTLLQTADIAADDEILSNAAKLVRRVRSLVYAADHNKQTIMPSSSSYATGVQHQQQRLTRHEQQGLRGSAAAVESTATKVQDKRQEHEEEYDGRTLARQTADIDDDSMSRKLYDATITFPECKEKFLEECLQILSQQLVELQVSADFIVHEKRNANQVGYNKVVIVTDLAATSVKGKLNDGMVEYPFLWDDAVEGYPRTLGVNGQWDCHALSPEDCCALITDSVPNPDTKGNYIKCHIFVPYGGIGNKKRSDRVIINLSPDGRVHEAPVIS